MSDSPTPTEEQPKNASAENEDTSHPFAEQLRALMKEHNISGVMLYVLPEDLEKESPAYHVARRGHFYDTSRLVSMHVRSIKERMMHDFDGLM